MRKLFVAFLALAGALTLLMPVREVAYADIEQVMVPEELGSRSARLRTAIDPRDTGDPDTVWIGHVYQSFWVGERNVHTGDITSTMVPAGGYGPYHVGRGNRLLYRAGGTIGDNGTWDFDRFQAGETDSLFGWWPIARAYQSGASSRPDYQRPFFALDYGNQVNYVINQRSPVDANGNTRTFGVVGLWHRDGGNIVYAMADTVEDKDPITGGTQDEITNVQPVLWSPTEVGGVGSTGSAWMGMRSHGDLSHREDPALGGTGNHFNSNLLQYQGNNGFNQLGSVHANGTDHNFPGYGSQMDQMLYRDVVLAEGDGLNISFSFSTNMSAGFNTDPGVRAGWFDKDPISNAAVGVGTGAPSSLDGNFISSDGAGAAAPRDSFMVYVGAPVNDAAAMLSNGSTPPVYDKKRRWFSEVLRLASACGVGSPCTIIGKEIVSTWGINAPTGVTLDFGTMYASELAAIKAVDGPSNGGTVRIVFRVKTNRGFDDENAGNPSASFNSGTRGAAIVDNVVVNGWAASNGDFEATNSIDNRTTTPPTAAWKSTGKPPAVYFHTDHIDDVVFDDPCGDQEDSRRICDMYGNVVNSGDHDQSGHKDGGVFGSNTQDRQRWFVSPTINLRASGNGAASDANSSPVAFTQYYNAMGIDDEVARTTTDYNCIWTYYNAGHVNATTETANFFSVGWQSYPARQQNGNIKWGEARHLAAISFYGSPRFCADVALGGAKANSMIRTTNAQNKPDSLRVYLHRIGRCYSFTTLTANECSPTGPLNSGTYFDNISVALIDGAPPSPVTMQIWNLINDAFPANRTDALVGASPGLDTAGAQVRIGFNLVPVGGTRPNVSGDSAVVVSQADNIRLDMVFRVKPGPGNYVTIGNPTSGVRTRPDAAGVLATPGDGSFFGEYMSSEGEFSSTAQHAVPSNAAHGTVWSEHIWNSCRMDTVEINLFPTGNNGSVVGLIQGVWRGSIHESDGKFSTLGITKNICYMPSPGGATNASNIKCNGVIGVGDWDPANYPTPASGWDGVTVTTKEHTKIIPDGLLTPGSHVQYFFRRSDIGGPASTYFMGPDTNFVIQPTEGSTDGHRWQQFSVLPDRWKDPAFFPYSTAPSMACMLYVDWCDRRGDERIWVGIADSIGATAATRYGAHNGWHARGDQSITVAVSTDPSIAVYAHGGQPGTMWDMYGVKASESSTTSSSLGQGALAVGLATGKDDRRGPTPLMLRNYYRVLLILTGDLNAGNIGPYAGKTSNDLALLNEFTAIAGGPHPKPRYVWAMGRHFAEGMWFGFGNPSTFSTWLSTYFAAGVVSGDYRFTTGFNQFEVAELRPNSALITGNNRYSVSNGCLVTNDLMSLNGTFNGQIAARYPDTAVPLPGGAGDPRIASVYAADTAPHEGVTLVEGFRISQFGAFETLRTGGRNNWFSQIITSLYDGLLGCSFTPGSPVAVGETPNNPLVNFLALRSENPHRGGDAQLRFGITRKERVELKVYDVTGRLVKTLANREFAAGEHTIFWDGTNEDGQLVSRGVYFYQLRTPTFVSQKKLAVLKH